MLKRAKGVINGLLVRAPRCVCVETRRTNRGETAAGARDQNRKKEGKSNAVLGLPFPSLSVSHALRGRLSQFSVLPGFVFWDACELEDRGYQPAPAACVCVLLANRLAHNVYALFLFLEFGFGTG